MAILASVTTAAAGVRKRLATLPTLIGAAHRWRMAVAVVLIVSVTTPVLAQESASRARDYEIKAAVLYLLSKFVEWPTSPPDTFTIGILGVDPFGEPIDRLLADKQVGGVPLTIRRVRVLDIGDLPRVLFISASERKSVSRIVGELDGKPTLTMSDMEGFADAGGMVQLVEGDSRMRFVINEVAARRSKLRISANVLGLAIRTIREDGRK
jgi:hypothetical protein